MIRPWMIQYNAENQDTENWNTHASSSMSPWWYTYVPVEARLLSLFQVQSKTSNQSLRQNKYNYLINLKNYKVDLMTRTPGIWQQMLSASLQVFLLSVLARDRAQKQACVLQARCSWLCEYANVYTNHHSGPCALQPAANDTQSLCHGKTCGEESILGERCLVSIERLWISSSTLRYVL